MRKGTPSEYNSDSDFEVTESCNVLPYFFRRGITIFFTANAEVDQQERNLTAHPVSGDDTNIPPTINTAGETIYSFLS